MPFSEGAPLREEYERLPVDFGYDQVTHRFNLPPASGSPELIIYASRSSSETRLQYGPLKTIVSSPLAQITSQSAEQDLTVTENAGAKFNLPLEEFAGVHSSLAFGIDYKNFRPERIRHESLLFYDADHQQRRRQHDQLHRRAAQQQPSATLIRAAFHWVERRSAGQAWRIGVSPS